MPTAPRVFTIPASAPHHETLARAILDGRVVPGWPDRADPLSLADGTVLLPNRRACRAFAEVLAEMVAGPTILPRIVPIGDVDEDELIFADPDPIAAIGLEAIAPAISAFERRVTLARLVRAWAESVDRAVLNLAAGDALVVSSTPGDALALAAHLMRLMDQVETEQVPWTNLDRIVEASLDRYWALSREFLTIATEHWPRALAERGLAEPSHRRDALIRAETERLKALDRPVIAAGSTGSILATRDLLKVVAWHARGALVLPGLDKHLDDGSFKAIGDAARPLHGHPQYGLGRLIAHVGVERDDVEPLVQPLLATREAYVSQALRPASTSEAWAGLERASIAEALDGLTVIEARSEQEEGLAVAIAIRAILEDEVARVAVVTPDRTLARRIAAELGRWEVEVDDSGGMPLADSPAAVVARLAARYVLDDPAPVTLLSILAHPAVDLGLNGPARERAVAAIELVGLRGLRKPGGLAGIAEALARPAPDRRGVSPARRITQEALADGRAVIGRLIEALQPLADLVGTEERPLGDFLGAHGRALDALVTDADTAGLEACRALFSEAGGVAARGFGLTPDDYPASFEALVATGVIRQPASPAARVRILGLPEARLLSSDHLVLAGLNEGVWPADPGLDPWFNRSMRAAFGIEPPERRIGLAAHDVEQFLGAPNVILTRAAKRGGVPTIGSRWLQRLATVAGRQAFEAGPLARGRVFLGLAEAIDQPAAVASLARPEPRPPLTARPASLSVTEIETLRHDPYAIYAKAILKLEELDGLDEEPGAAERGTLIHDALARYVRAEESQGPAADPLARLIAIGAELFAAHGEDAAVRALWWPRFERIAGWFVGADAERRRKVRDVLVEVRGQLAFDTPAGRRFVLRGVADRIDLNEDGSVAIVDYKTGSTPARSEVWRGDKPQLPLEAAIAVDGGFPGVPAGSPIAEIAYAPLTGRQPPGRFEAVEPPKGRDLDGMIAEARAGLEALIAAFENEAQPYAPGGDQGALNRPGPYAHLARIAEWALSGDET